MLDPWRTGFTTTGSGRDLFCPGLRISNCGVGMPFSTKIFLLSSLSNDRRLASGPDPVYGIFRALSRACTCPSSPNSPCKATNTASIPVRQIQLPALEINFRDIVARGSERFRHRPARIQRNFPFRRRPSHQNADFLKTSLCHVSALFLIANSSCAHPAIFSTSPAPITRSRSPFPKFDFKYRHASSKEGI